VRDAPLSKGIPKEPHGAAGWWPDERTRPSSYRHETWPRKAERPKPDPRCLGLSTFPRASHIVREGARPVLPAARRTLEGDPRRLPHGQRRPPYPHTAGGRSRCYSAASPEPPGQADAEPERSCLAGLSGKRRGDDSAPPSGSRRRAGAFSALWSLSLVRRYVCLGPVAELGRSAAIPAGVGQGPLQPIHRAPGPGRY
jgi:hypothetical protein